MAGKRVQENGKSYLCLFVAKHKTSKTYGPATLYLSGHGKIGQIGKNWIKDRKFNMLVRAQASPEEPLLTRASGTSYISHYQ